MQDAAPGPKSKKLIGILTGVAAGAVFAFALYVLLSSVYPGSGMLLYSVLLIPPAACALAVLVAGFRRDTRESAVGISSWVVTALLVGSAIVFREGAICLAMAATIFYPLGMLGGVLAKHARSPANTRLSVAALVLAPLLLAPLERPDAYPTFDAEVVTQIEIDAPLETVWREAVEIRAIRADEQIWTLTQDVLQVPKPVDARLTTRGGEQVREATWAGGIHFTEILTDRVEHESLAWRFEIPEAAADQLLDEHLRLDEDYLRLHGGRYALEALSPTRTRLTLSTRYSARTPLNAYARAWGQVLLNDIHHNVLHIVRARAEASA